MKERIQKIIAQSGYCSRRKAEDLIRQGKVTLNDKAVTELGTKADPNKDKIKVGSFPIKREKRVYYILNKPTGYVTTVKDEQGRQTVVGLVKTPENIYPVGRLDMNTEGLLLLTNDGDFTYKVSHPKHEHEKEYLVKVRGLPSQDQIKKLEEGIVIDKKKTAPCKIKMSEASPKHSWLYIIIKEGRYHQVRKMFSAIKHPVLYLKRTRIDFLTLKNLKTGEYRPLTNSEVKKLMES